MLFTIAGNKALLCFVAVYSLLIGRWSHHTKSHIVKKRQKHMSRKCLPFKTFEPLKLFNLMTKFIVRCDSN